jgi:uncharacterized protein (TIGR02147 family)
MFEKRVSYRELLRAEFDQRVKHNPRYSLRAFAKALDIAPSRLSEVFRGKQGLSLSWAERISDVLKFDDERKQHFCDLVEAEHARLASRRRMAQHRLKNYEQRMEKLLRLDAFEMVADWTHGAIRELVLTDGFKSDPRFSA